MKGENNSSDRYTNTTNKHTNTKTHFKAKKSNNIMVRSFQFHILSAVQTVKEAT